MLGNDNMGSGIKLVRFKCQLPTYWWYVVLIFGPSVALSISFCYTNYMRSCECLGFLGGAVGKESSSQCRRCKRLESDPWVWKIPGEGHDNPLQYSCLENLMDRGAWGNIAHGVTKSQTQLSPPTPNTHTQTWVLRHPTSMHWSFLTFPS